jgi:hypothetical protein
MDELLDEWLVVAFGGVGGGVGGLRWLSSCCDSFWLSSVGDVGCWLCGGVARRVLAVDGLCWGP